MAVTETNTEQQYYTAIDECFDLMQTLPKNCPLKNDIDKLHSTNQELASQRMKLYELENMEIPASPRLYIVDDEAELSIETTIVADEEPTMIELTKQIELKSLECSIKSLKEIIEAKSKSLVNYARTYESHAKSMVKMNLTMNSDNESKISPKTS